MAIKKGPDEDLSTQEQKERSCFRYMSGILSSVGVEGIDDNSQKLDFHTLDEKLQEALTFAYESGYRTNQIELLGWVVYTFARVSGYKDREKPMTQKALAECINASVRVLYHIRRDLFNIQIKPIEHFPEETQETMGWLERGVERWRKRLSRS